MKDEFRIFAQRVACAVGTPSAFGIAFVTILLWAVTGPMFHYSDTWQLVINTSTTIVTFLMVFLIQNSQNRDSRAIQLKLDELIRVNNHARNKLMNLEQMSDSDLEGLHAEFLHVQEETAERLNKIVKHRTQRRAHHKGTEKTIS